jgi:sn-glycerol 3-phosphate transport system permease protein
MPLLPGTTCGKTTRKRCWARASWAPTPRGAHDVGELVVAMIITVGKIAISLLSAFAIVYFRFPFKMLCFWLIFVTLMLPVEVRIGPTRWWPTWACSTAMPACRCR